MLYKRGTVWWMRFTHQNLQVRKSTETTDKKLAERIYHTVRGKVAEGKWFEASQPCEEKTFQDLMVRYLRELSARNKAPSSHLRDRSLADHLLKEFGDLRLTEIRPARIAGYKEQRRTDGAAPQTINHELGLMRHAFNIAIREWEWIAENPVLKVSREKVNNLVERWLTDEEEARLLTVSPTWLQEIILFALYTGLRKGEILDLQWSQVDLFRKTVTLLKQKNEATDTLPLNRMALDALRARTKVRHIRSHYVFGSANGTRRTPRNLSRAFDQARRRADIVTFRFHDLRHTFATRLVAAGVDLCTVKKLGRWKTLAMVMRYAHHNPENLRPGVERLDTARLEISTNLAQSPDQRITECV